MALRITGLGILNGLGVGKEAFWQQLLNGTCGIVPIQSFDTTPYRSDLGGEIRNFDPKDFMPPRFYRRLSRLSRLAVAASIEAVQDSGITFSRDNAHRFGSIFSTAFGSTHQTDSFFLSLLDDGPQGAEPFLFPDTVPNAPSSHVAMYHKLRGPNSTFCQNHLSGECALAFAMSLLESGQADGLLVGSVDELSPILFHCLDALRALKPIRHEGVFRPDQLDSGEGFILGEGSTCIMVEREDAIHARQNMQPSEVSSLYGIPLTLALTSAPTAQGHYEAEGEAIAESMGSALEQAKLRSDMIDVIGLAANGIEELEIAEARALEKVFGSSWYEIPRIPLRYIVGEFGGAGLLAVATLSLSIHEGVIPPFILGRKLTGDAGDPRRFSPAKKADLRYGMVIGATFGGGSSCCIIAKAN